MKHKVSHNVETPAVPPVAVPPLQVQPAAAEPLHGVAAASVSAAVELVTCQEQLTAQQDHYLRLAADFENFRKRTQRETAQQSAADKHAFILDLLPILDNLERALACDQAEPSGPLHAGVAMTLRQLGQLLERNGIAGGEDVGQPFDPHRHEAIAVRNDPHKPDHSILEVTQRGYGSTDSVFRPARVVVNDWSHAAGAAHAG
jgi:molecular chaperone GrpE